MKSEVQYQLKLLKKDKAIDMENISGEQVGKGGEALAESLCKLFNRILVDKEIPWQWKNAKIFLIPKKGNSKSLSNLRPISIIPILYKIFAKTIQKRIKPTLEEYQTCDQAGFRKSFSTLDHILAVKQLIEKSKQYNTKIYMALIDYKKAFDTVKHQYMIEAISKAGVDEGYIEIIKAIYENPKAVVSLENLGREFQLQRGLRQGDPLSPDLFNCVIQTVFDGRSNEDRGVKINGKILDNLKFADDVILFEQSAEKLEKAIGEIASLSAQAGLEINLEKTHILTNDSKKDIKLHNTSLNYASETVYLGQIISFENQMEKEIKRRIDLSWKAFWKLKRIFKGNFRNALKFKMLEKCIYPVLCYGCQTWTLTKNTMNRLEVAQRKFIRSILKHLKMSVKFVVFFFSYFFVTYFTGITLCLLC